MADAEVKADVKRHGPPISTVREWLALLVGVALVLWGFIDGVPARVLVGFSLLGGQPITLAAKEPTP